MSETVGVAELRQNLSVYLRRVAAGERLTVTDRNRPVAELVPLAEGAGDLDRLVAEGRLIPPRTRRRRFEPLRMPGPPGALTDALDEVRGEH